MPNTGPSLGRRKVVGQGHLLLEGAPGNPQILFRGRVPFTELSSQVGEGNRGMKNHFIPSSFPVSTSLHLSPFLVFSCFFVLLSFSSSLGGGSYSYTFPPTPPLSPPP